MVVGKTAALFAAAGAGAIPALAYSSWIVEEPLAYPYAALCFFLIAKALVTRAARLDRRRDRRVARRPCRPQRADRHPGAPRARAALRVLVERPGEDAARELVDTATGIGCVRRSPLGAIFLLSGIGSHHSDEWYTRDALVQAPRIFEGNWAAGALAIGIGRLPFVARARSALPSRGEQRTRELRMRSLVRGRRDRRLRPLHRHEGRVPVDRLRDARRGAQPHLHRAAPLRRHGASSSRGGA